MSKLRGEIVQSVDQCAESYGIENTNLRIVGLNNVLKHGINMGAAPHGINMSGGTAAPHGINMSGGTAAPHGIEKTNIQLGAWMQELKLDIPSPMSPSRCIFRVPNRLRCEREKAVHYTPRVISIGPIHHRNKALKRMEEHKKRYLQYFMARTDNFNMMKGYKEKIQKEEVKLRSCYSETIDIKKFSSDEFVKIILVDAIFIIEFLYRSYRDPEVLDEDDCIFGKPRMVEDVWPDLLMLENQLPFFILVDLFDPLKFDFHPKRSEKSLSIPFLSYYFLNGVPTFGGRSNDLKKETLEKICYFEVKHFVDLLRKLCIAAPLKEPTQPSVDGQCILLSLGTNVMGAAMSLGKIVMGAAVSLGKQVCSAAASLGITRKVDANDSENTNLNEGTNVEYITAPSIEELHLAGAKFEKKSTKNLFNMQFECGILKIPKLKTDDRTELVLRNLVAFEQCAFIAKNEDKNKSAFEESDFEKCYISAYVNIMDQFVDTSKDVKLLVKNEIVENILGGGDDALSTMINSVSTGVIPNSIYDNLCKELNDFCNSKWNKSKANLRQNYCNTPWATLSVCAAVILLILTVFQTICSIISLS